MVRLERMFERAGLDAWDLPDALAGAYGGAIGFAAPRVIANFVSSVDGVVTVRGPRESGGLISGASEGDRFVMGLLRACADVVLIGAETFRKAGDHVWNAETIFPPLAAAFAELRARRGLAAQPPLAIVSASGELDAARSALDGAHVITTARGAERLRDHARARLRVTILDEPIRLPAVINLLQAEGARLILTEGGPTLVGELLAERRLDELFLTIAPSLWGRSPDDGRKSLAAGVDLRGAPLELASARRHDSHLLVRYTIG